MRLNRSGLSVSRQFPTLVPGRRTRRGPRRGTGPGEGVPKLKTWLEILYTFNQANPYDYSQNGTPSYKKGTGWRVWYDAVERRIYNRGGVIADEVWSTDDDGNRQVAIELGTRIAFAKEAVLDLASLADYAVLASHFPPANHVADIKTRGDVKVGFNFLNFESFGQSLAWRGGSDMFFDNLIYTGALAALETADLNGYVAGTGPDEPYQAGPSPLVDYYETTTTGEYFNSWYNIHAAPGTPPPPYDIGPRGTRISKHTFLCVTDTIVNWRQMWIDRWGLDIGPGPWESISYAGAMGYAISDFLNENFYTYGLVGGGLGSALEFIMFDQIFENGPYTGSATTTIPAWYDNSRYVNGWSDLFLGLKTEWTDQLNPARPWIWGNSGTSVGQYSSELLPGRFLEHSFRNLAGSGKGSWSDVKSRLDEAVTNGLVVTFGGVDEAWTPQGWFTMEEGPGGEYGTWRDFWARVDELDAFDEVIVQAGRSEADGYLFWNPYMNDPRARV